MTDDACHACLEIDATGNANGLPHTCPVAARKARKRRKNVQRLRAKLAERDAIIASVTAALDVCTDASVGDLAARVRALADAIARIEDEWTDATTDLELATEAAAGLRVQCEEQARDIASRAAERVEMVAALEARGAEVDRLRAVAAAERALRKAEVAEHVESGLATAEAMLRGAISDTAARALADAERATNDASAALIGLGVDP